MDKLNQMKLFLSLLLSFSFITCFANDSTLYKKRIHKIEQLHLWLANRPYNLINNSKIDTSHVNWKSYDTVINYFFDFKQLDSLYASKAKQYEIFAPSAKREILKFSISIFHELAQNQRFSTLKIKQPVPDSSDMPLSKDDFFYFDNAILLYRIIDGKEIPWVGFLFAEKETSMLSVLVFVQPDIAH